MRTALQLAERQLGRVWPNPTVGALVVQSGVVVGRGVTANGGRPHAETAALEAAGGRAQGSTLYVSLEPCCHTGQTPPCTDAIIKAGIKRVVVGCRDRDARAAGEGLAQLRQAGIEVTEDVLENEATALNAGFFSRIEKNRPLVNLKIASSIDGRIAAASGQSQWITGEAVRAQGHRLRARHDAILTGIDTVLADNPLMTCRLPGMEDHSPIRIVLDSNFRFLPDCHMAQTAREVGVWVITLAHSVESQQDKRSALESLGVRVITAEGDGGRIRLPTLLTMLASEGITRLMVEAGNRLSTAFMNAQLVDRLYWFRGNMVIGGNGLAALGACMPSLLNDIPRFKLESATPLHNDMIEIYACSPAS